MAYIAISMYCNAKTTLFMSGTDKAFVMTVIETGKLQTLIMNKQVDDNHCKKLRYGSLYGIRLPSWMRNTTNTGTNDVIL